MNSGFFLIFLRYKVGFLTFSKNHGFLSDTLPPRPFLKEAGCPKMARKRIVKTSSSSTIEEVIPRFITAKTAAGVSDSTIKTYRSHFFCISKHLDFTLSFNQLTKDHLNYMIVSMRESDLAHNSIASYTRVFRTFLKWCNEEGLTTLTLPNIKDKETVKPTYTDAELSLLLRKPDANCDFTEFRNWTIINFFLNCGCRAATIRNIQIRDVDLGSRQILFRHTKNGRVQAIPLCGVMVNILLDYMAIRGGEPTDYLFCSEFGEMLTEEALRSAVAKYNRRRGVKKTSLHLFRHTFARKYLVDCGGDAFTLQTLLGHKTLTMTRHYCAIYDQDIANNFDRLSPLAQISKPKEKIARK